MNMNMNIESRTFVVAVGQRDNLGDSLLRRPLIKAAQMNGPCHILIGNNSADWDNLGIRPSDHVYTDRLQWLASLSKSLLWYRVNLVLNAGELHTDRKYVISRISLLPLFLLVKAKGGAILHPGFGLRNPRERPKKIVILLAKLSNLVCWRDEASRSSVGIGTTAPDWAFLEGSETSSIRSINWENQHNNTLVLSLRGDRPLPSSDWYQSVKDISRSLNARIVVACQVRRDSDRSKLLAEALGGELVDWPEDSSHNDQELILRKTYAAATWIASDRLHVVICAVTEGAVPLDIVPDTSRKISRTLAVNDMYLFPSDNALNRLNDDRILLLQDLDNARIRLQEVFTEVAKSLANQKKQKIQILHSIAAPTGVTKYSRHMAATEDFNIKPHFFSWTKAFLSKFHVFHLHWPEHFIPDGNSARDRIQRLLATAFLHRMERKRIPVVRTLHNITPHSGVLRPQGQQLRQKLNSFTATEIHLVPGDTNVSAGTKVLVPHGSYREAYAITKLSQQLKDRILHFGRLERYKGTLQLIDAFRSSSALDLKIVGQPSDKELVNTITEFAHLDKRISCDFRFVSDDALAEEINQSTLCVFPYNNLHSSGAVLVALSLNRPVLVSRSHTTESLLEEVGSTWVRIFDDLDGPELESALLWAQIDRSTTNYPKLDKRSWQIVRSAHAKIYETIDKSLNEVF